VIRLEVLSPVIISAAAMVFVVAERLFPYDPQQRLFRDGFWTDLCWYTLVQGYVLAVVISGLIRWVDGWTGLSHLQLLSGWSLAGQMVFFFVTHDFYIYWFHRLQHRSSALWRIHEAHHSVKDVDWLAGSRSHALEILINQTVEFLPMVLLGANPEVPILKGMLDAVWGMYIHSNIDVHSGPVQRILNGPEMHRWHHAVEMTAGGINFGTKLAIWDWLFSTAHQPPQKPVGYGLGGVDFPRGYFPQLLFAFRRFELQDGYDAAESAPENSSTELLAGR